MGDVLAVRALYSLGRVASSVQHEFLGAQAQKTNAPPIPDADELVTSNDRA
jgi:hypothetical protein